VLVTDKVISTGAQLVLDLLWKGYSVGIASNSHKAINNLLGGG
jgi:hypothetical protein